MLIRQRTRAALLAISLRRRGDNFSALARPPFLPVVLAAYAAVILLVDPKRFALTTWHSRKRTAHDIGEIIGVQSTNTFLAKLYSDREPVRRFDLVEFRYSMAEDRGIFKGMIVDNYLLNEQQWVKILATDEIQEAIGSGPTSSVTVGNVVYKLDRRGISDVLSRFVGVVIDSSNIMKVRFDYAGQIPVSEGNLLEARIGGQRILYQSCRASRRSKHSNRKMKPVSSWERLYNSASGIREGSCLISLVGCLPLTRRYSWLRIHLPPQWERVNDKSALSQEPNTQSC